MLSHGHRDFNIWILWGHKHSDHSIVSFSEDEVLATCFLGAQGEEGWRSYHSVDMRSRDPSVWALAALLGALCPLGPQPPIWSSLENNYPDLWEVGRCRGEWSQRASRSPTTSDSFHLVSAAVSPPRPPRVSGIHSWAILCTLDSQLFTLPASGLAFLNAWAVITCLSVFQTLESWWWFLLWVSEGEEINSDTGSLKP